MIKLGSKVKDRITGFTGIAVARTEWLNACSRITIQSQKLHQGSPIDNHTFDEPDIVVLKEEGIPTVKEAKPGGPRPEPKRRGDV